MLSAIVGLLGTALFGIFTWVLQVGNRVTVLETKEPDLKELINTKFEALERDLRDIKQEIRRAR